MLTRHTMRRNKLLLLISATLVSLAFGQETALKSDLPSEPTAGTARLGRLVVGKGVKLLSSGAERNNGSEVQDGFADHSEGYQSDQQGSTAWYKAAESKLRRLNPSVHCGEDAMALRVQGSRVPNFMVDRGEDGLLPVSQIPANCGLSVKRARRDVLLTANYGGCHVMQEDEAYILTLRLWGAPVNISCPVPTSTHDTHATTPAIEPLLASDPQKPVHVFPGYMPLNHRHPFYQYGYPWATVTSTVQSTASIATSTAPTVPASDAQKPGSPFDQVYPFGHVHHWPPYYRYGYPWVRPTRTPTVAPSTTASTATSTAPTVPARDQEPGSPFDQVYPFGHVHHWPYYRYGYPWVRPTRTPTVAPTTTASTATSKATTVPARDQEPGSPFDQVYPFGYAPHWPPYYRYGYPWARPTRTPTVVPTTTASTATSKAPTVPARDQEPGSPFDQLYPLDYVPHRHWHPYYQNGHPWDCFTSTPTVAPTTTTVSTPTSTAPTVPASDPQEPGSPFAKVYPFGYFPYRGWRPHF